MRRNTSIRPCRTEEADAIAAIVNAAAEAYRGVIPHDCWHEPYFPAAELDDALAEGVIFWGAEIEGALAGVMGLQRVGEVDLIRHAYVSPQHQGCGVGGALLTHLRAQSGRPMLIGTWAAADWAIRFYRGHGFELVGPERAAELLAAYWRIGARQAQASVVLADPRFS